MSLQSLLSNKVIVEDQNKKEEQNQIKQDKVSVERKNTEQPIKPEDPEAFEAINTLLKSGLNPDTTFPDVLDLGKNFLKNEIFIRKNMLKDYNKKLYKYI